MPTLTIGQTAIPYEIRRSPKVRRQRIVVTPQGMEVVAPVGADNQDIEVFVHRRRRWIYEQREKMREQLASSPWPEHFVSGAKIPYRGRRMRLKVRTVSGDSIITYYHNGFIVEMPNSIPADEHDALMKHTLTCWLQRRMEDDTQAFVRHYARKMGEEPKGVRIKDQKHLWGSCGKDRMVNLNWRLIFMPKTVLEYAVVHELCHLRYRNHSAAFWSLLRSLLPDYERRKAWLEQHGAGYEL